jgi:hypothetical protein
MCNTLLYQNKEYIIILVLMHMAEYESLSVKHWNLLYQCLTTILQIFSRTSITQSITVLKSPLVSVMSCYQMAPKYAYYEIHPYITVCYMTEEVTWMIWNIKHFYLLRHNCNTYDKIPFLLEYVTNQFLSWCTNETRETVKCSVTFIGFLQYESLRRSKNIREKTRIKIKYSW